MTVEATNEVNLEKPLEFAVFSQLPMHIAAQDQGDKLVVAHLLEVSGDLVVGETTESLEELLSRPICVSFAFKRKCLTFTAEWATAPVGFEASSPAHKIIAFRKPARGQILNRRDSSRTPLREIGPAAKARFRISGALGDFAVQTNQLVNYSHRAIALIVDRSAGLVLPGDRVNDFSLTLSGRTVLSSQGSVSRVSNRVKNDQLKNGYLVVIDLAPNDTAVRPPESSTERRKPGRAHLLEKSAFVSFKHPFFPAVTVSGPVIDLSHSGMSFVVSNSQYPLVAGMNFHNVEVQLPMQPRMTCSFTCVSSRYSAGGEATQYRLGVRFDEISPEFLRVVNQTVQASSNDNISDANDDDYEQLWEFFFETGFVYKDKRKQLQDYARQLFVTYTRLLNSNSPICKKILYKEEGVIRGHVSGIRFFDNSWLIQHLNALKSSSSQSAAQSVVNAMCDFFIDERTNRKMGTNFITCFYRPDNLYPSIVFGETKRFAANPLICDTVDLDYCVMTLHEALQNENYSDVEVAEAGSEQLSLLENALVNQEKYQLIRIEGLTADRITKLAVSAEFEKHSLYRHRRVFFAKSKTSGEMAFAVCNYASPGINLSELTNSFRIFFSKLDSVDNKHLATALSEKVIESYAKTEMPSVILLAEPGQALPRQFTKKKVYRYWFHDTSHMQSFRDATTGVFNNIKEFVKKFHEDNKTNAA